MLKPISKEPSVNDSERILAKISNETFFSLWSYPSLFRSVGKGKELIDLTVYFDNTLILFSDKGQVKYQAHTETYLAWSRWYRSAVKESAKQLHAAEKFVRHSPDQIFLNSKLQEKFPYDISRKDLKIHLIAVTRGITIDAKKHFDSIKLGSSGSLAYNYKHTEEHLLKLPFWVGDVDPNKTFVHVLDESGISLLMKELCTPADFIHYLETKEKAIRADGLAVSYGEEETLAHYLLSNDSVGFGSIEIPQGPDNTLYIIREWQWRDYRQSLQYALRYGRIKHAKKWNELIARFSDCIVSGNVGEGADMPLLNHAAALKVLASENIYSSALLAESLFDKFETVPNMARSARVMPSPMQPNRIYVFAFTPMTDEFKNYEEYRAARLEYMALYGQVVRYKYPESSEILVFGSNTKGSQQGSESIFVIDNSEKLTADQKQLARRIMREAKILNDTTETRFRGASNVPVVERNEPCPCGSGKKYKKCHYLM